MHLPFIETSSCLFNRLSRLGCIGLLAWTVSCARQSGERPLAEVGDTAITKDDLIREAQRIRQTGRPVPEKQALLRELILQESLVQRARKQGLHLDPALRRELENLLVGRLQDLELAPRLAAVKVERADVEAEYQRHITEYARPAKMRLAVVSMKLDRLMSGAKQEELRARMAEARVRALASPAPGGRGPAAGGFGEVALHFSEDQSSRYRGGDLGWMDVGTFPSRWPRAVLEAGFALPPGEVSPVIEAEGGLYLVMKTDARSSFTVPLESVEASLRKKLLAARRESLTEAYHEELTASVEIRTNPEALAALSLPEATTVPDPDPSPPAMPVASLTSP